MGSWPSSRLTGNLIKIKKYNTPEINKTCPATFVSTLSSPSSPYFNARFRLIRILLYWRQKAYKTAILCESNNVKIAAPGPYQPRNPPTLICCPAIVQPSLVIFALQYHLRLLYKYNAAQVGSKIGKKKTTLKKEDNTERLYFCKKPRFPGCFPFVNNADKANPIRKHRRQSAEPLH